MTDKAEAERALEEWRRRNREWVRQNLVRYLSLSKKRKKS